MPAISFTQKGDFSKTLNWLDSLKHVFRSGILDRYGQKGVEVLQTATPVDSGVTASSWYYKVQNDASGATLSFHNSNIVNGVPIAIILQYGHGTGTGGWVEGRDYINPAIQPIFDELTEQLWKEVSKV